MSNSTMPQMEEVSCYICQSDRRRPLLVAEDDLTGKPGRFPFVVCQECGLSYQFPRISVEGIKAYYGDEYVAHRKKRNWGLLGGLVIRAMAKLDRSKLAIVRHYLEMHKNDEVLDVGCGAGTFLLMAQDQYGVKPVGVDFIDLASLPGFERIEFHCGLLYDAELGQGRFKLITMWHFLEHDYDPDRSLKKAREALQPDGLLVIEVPRLDSLSYRLYHERWPGLQAPQHTVLYSRETLLRQVAAAGFEVVDYLPYGAYPAYFYLFAGAAFKLLQGRGLDFGKIVVPYFLLQLLLTPLLLFEKQLNLSMQTVVLRKLP